MPTAVLLLWPFVAVLQFVGLGPVRGLIWSTCIGYLFLPDMIAYELPGPDYGKRAAITLGLLVGAIVSPGRAPVEPVPNQKFRIVLLLLFLAIFVGFFGTVLDNTEPLVRGGRFQQGHAPVDVLGLNADMAMALVPFLLARRWLFDAKHHAEILQAFVLLGLVYSFLVLFELRMSPQLNRMVYGFFPHDWQQHVRGSGYRPIVFLGHGLSVGFFLFVASVSAFALVRCRGGKVGMLCFLVGVWFFLVLVLSKNLGAIFQAAVFAPLVLVFGRRFRIWVVTAIAVLVLTYPLSRPVMPVDRLVAVVAHFAPDRAQSLEFRSIQEDRLLTRAKEKPIFGWGGWGRNRVIDERGRNAAVPDGMWIMWFGTYGWVGYLGFFGLVAAPVIFLRRMRDVGDATVGLAVILAGALFYSIPNSELSQPIFLTAGAVAGFLQFRVGEVCKGRRRLRYSRFGSEDIPVPYRRTLEARFSRGRSAASAARVRPSIPSNGPRPLSRFRPA